MDVVEFKDVSKRFGETLANDRLSFKIKSGSIHAIVGENGAGKSTAMKILFGLVQLDSGEVYIRGRPTRFRNPRDAIQHGIGMVHQHFMLSEIHSALDNLVLGDEPASGFWRYLPRGIRRIDRKKVLTQLQDLSKQYGFDVPWGKDVQCLPVGVQQRIEILKLLYRQAEILILDEPTAVLTPPEVEDFFKNLRRLREHGKTILIITHKLKEVMALSDYITVFRQGKIVGEFVTKETTAQSVAEKMVGRHVDLGRLRKMSRGSQEENRSKAEDFVSLRLENISDKTLKDLNLEVYPGEIVGIAGVEGNGQSEILNWVMRPQRPKKGLSGKVWIQNQEVTRTPLRDRKTLGVGFIPEDRQNQGLVLPMSVCENLLLGRESQKQFQNRGILNWGIIRNRFGRILEEFDIRPRNLDLPVAGLSGGNQQKVVIGREFDGQLKLLVAAQPTRGVDVGAIEFIHDQILKARSRGCGVLLISSELDEILDLADRIFVLFQGKWVKEFSRGQVDESELGLAMGGGR